MEAVPRFLRSGFKEFKFSMIINNFCTVISDLNTIFTVSQRLHALRKPKRKNAAQICL